MFIHGLPRETADEVRLRAVGKGERVGEIVERFGAHRTLAIELLGLVALTVYSSRSKGKEQHC